MSRSPQTRVYFIKPTGMDGPIKIGCSRIPADRLLALNIWSPFPLEIIGSTPGSWKDERFLHKCFSHLHTHSEWFQCTEVLEAEIAKILEHGIDYARSNLTPTGDIHGGRTARSAESRARMSQSMREAWAIRKGRLAAKAVEESHAS